MVQSLGLTLFALATARTAVSIAVTAHVLLRKSDVRAALGWIGVAWLSPIVGGPLYFLFGINRVTRAAP
jgi:cardiolipin synthase A/B